MWETQSGPSPPAPLTFPDNEPCESGRAGEDEVREEVGEGGRTQKGSPVRVLQEGLVGSP
jgi:hypothetical protein